MKLGFLYAGQGSQRLGMGADFYQHYSSFRALFDGAALDFDLKTLCFDGPAETLADTRFTQPCMVAFAAGVSALLAEEGIVPQCAAGLSLGEYSALHAAGVWDVQTTLSLVAFRGKVMAAAVDGRPCGMSAVLYLGRDALKSCCKSSTHLGICEIANYNCPDQMVIGGDCAAVEQAGALALAAGAKRVVPLTVSGPFHTSLMSPAGDALRERFQSVSFGQMAFPVYFNATAAPVGEGETVPALLERQVQSSVYLEDSIRAMLASGVDTFVEIGPGKTLCGFVKKISRDTQTYSIDTVEDFRAVVAALKGALQ